MNKQFWILIVLAFVMIAGMAFYWFFYIQRSSNNPNPTPSTTSPEATSSASISPSGAITPTPVDSSSAKTQIKVFMIATDDNGKSGKLIGCGDSAVAVVREVPYTTGVLKAAFTELLSIKDKNYGQSGLYNPLYQSSLTLLSAAIDESGHATIKLSGNLQLIGECEDPRIKAQLEETAKQFPTVKSLDILINDKNLNDIMSLEG